MSAKIQPDAAAGNVSAAAPRKFGDKRDVGELAGGMSKRWVDGEMAKGMPHLKLGARRVRFDLEEVAAWLKQQYHVQRRAA